MTKRVRRNSATQVVEIGSTRLSRITVINRRRTDDSGTREDTEDSIGNGMAIGTLAMPTPYDIEELCGIFERSNILRQCVDAIVVNTCSYGYRIIKVDEDTPIDEDEKAMLKSFVDSANPEEALETVIGNTIEDMERLGFGFLEVIRADSGAFSHVRYIRSRYVKATAKGNPTRLVKKMRRGRTIVDVTSNYAFRKYVQTINGNKVYFKEFGDPRKMSYKTGAYEGEDGARVRKNHLATELIHFRQKSDDIYGIPKWVHQMPSILGSREAEECNFQYFEDNMIPAGILTVAGGRLSSASHRDLMNVLSNSGLGRDRQNKLLLLEAVPEKDGLDDSSNVTIKLEKLTDARPSDSLFREYDRGNQDKARGTWRLPATAVGASQDTTFATANVSQAVAESQVYLPARRYKDNILNKMLVNGERGLNLKTCKLESLAPAITNPEAVVKAMTALGVLGGISPRDAVKLANQELRIPLDQYPEKGEDGYEDWMDMPTHVLMKLVKDPLTSDDEANGKDAATKALEDSGDMNVAPEKGSE